MVHIRAEVHLERTAKSVQGPPLHHPLCGAARVTQEGE